LTGQFLLRTIENKIDAELREMFKMTGNEVSPNESLAKYLVYVDTDSCRGDSVIEVDGNKITIEEFYESCSEYIKRDDLNRDYVKPVRACSTPSVNTHTQRLEYKQINYVMRHRVNKEMYNISIDGCTVCITADHSLIIRRDGSVRNVKPFEVVVGDELIRRQAHDLTFTSQFTVESLGIQELDVYDIEVEGNHNFFANDICIHNSLYFTLDSVFKKYNVTGEKAIKALEKLSQEKLAPVVNKICQECCDYMHSYENKIFFKTEIAASKVIYCCVPDTQINVDGEIKRIEDYYNESISEDRSDMTPSFDVNTRELCADEIYGVYKKKYKGKIYTFTAENNHSVSVTEDHTMFIKRNGEVIEVLARDVLDTDELIYFDF
jgi:hypothetical protein